MEFVTQNANDLLIEMNRLRNARGLSYQAVADACEVSQSTIIRVFKGETEPSYALLQKIAAAVQYKPAALASDKTPDFSANGYIEHLRESLVRQSAENDRRVMQLQAHYNMLLRRKDRIINMLSVVLGLLVSAFIFWLIIDVTHPTVGWIQR